MAQYQKIKEQRNKISVGALDEKDMSKEQGERLERAIAKCNHMSKIIAKPIYSKKPSFNKRIIARNF